MNNSLKESITIQSDTECISKIEKAADIFFQKASISQEMYGKVYLALIEASENAISHGNNNKAEKTVWVKFEKNKKEIIIDIKDEGTGFDYRSVPDPTLPKNLEKPGGRGIFIISNLCDNLQFEKQGSTIQMTFKLK